MKSFLFKEIINRFYKAEKPKLYLLFLMTLFTGMIEFLGLVLIFQFVFFLSSPNQAHNTKIIEIFSTYFPNIDTAYASLFLGITIACIYIFKNLYMLFYIWHSRSIMEDLAIKVTSRTINNLLFQDFIKVNSIPYHTKHHIVTKISTVVWGFCLTYINLISNSIIALILISYLFIKFTTAAIAATIFILTLFFIEYSFLRKNSKYQDEHFAKTHSEMHLMLLKIIDAIKEIKLSNLQEKFSNAIYDKTKEFTTLNKKRSYWGTFHVFFTEISIMITFIVVLVVLFFTSNFNNQYLISSIATISVVVLRLTPTINRIQTSLYSLNSNQNITKEILDFDNIFDKNISYNLTKEKLPFKNNIKLENISFTYDKSIEGLKNINLKINNGEFVGIVGESGCYKTTLSLIIAGLIKPSEGNIYIDNQALNDKTYQKWQNNIALLSQDYKFLFDSVDEISSDYINKLNLDDINSNLDSLSYGQKQRVALANILAQDKSVLILDEISSSSDVISEEKINNVLKTLKGQKTMISIAHRLHILKHCDRIIYMGKGKIIDFDTFENLGNKYPDFKKIIELSNFSV